MDGAEKVISILIAVDDVLILNDLDDRIRNMGCHVCAKTNRGEEALFLAERFRPDLLIVETGLKGEMDGIEAASAIRDRLDVPVIYLTAHSDAEGLERAVMTRPFGCLMKPVRDDDLKLAIKLALHAARLDSELRKNEIELKLKSDTLDYAPNAFVIVTENSEYIYANQAYLNMWGYDSLEEMNATLPKEHFADPSQYGGFIMTLKENGECTIETTARRKDGCLFDVLMYARIAADRQGREIYTATYIDITDRKQAEMELRENEARLQALSDAPFESIFFSEKGVCIDQNRTAERMFGYTRGEAIGRHGTEWIIPEDREVVKNKMMLDFAKAYEITALRKDGATFPAEIQARNFSYKGRRVRVTALRDITERKRTEEALRDSERRFRNVMESVNLIAVMLDLNGEITFCNDYLLEVTGWKRDEVIGKIWFDYFLPPEIREKMKSSVFLKTIRTGNFPIHYENEIITRTNERRLIAWTNTVHSGGDGSVIGVTSIGEDITERKRAEQRIQAALKEKEVLLQEIHHRVRNNMQVIISLMKLQADHIDDEYLIAAFNESQNRIHAMAAVHETLHQSDNLAGIDLANYLTKLCETSFQTFRTDFGVIDLNVEINPIELKLEQSYPVGLVFNELLSNSLKYAFPNNCQGKIKISGKLTDNDNVKLIIDDDGVGLPAGYDWRNADSLGLQIVRTLVEDQLGGSIELDNSNGARWEINFHIL